MKAKRVLTLIIALAMIISTIPATGITAFAADKTLVILDTDKKASITKAGFAADDKNVNKTKYSAKWKVDDEADKFIKDFPTDISNYGEIHFSMKVDSTDSAVIMFYIGSENKAVDGIDYYSKVFTVKPGEWQDYTIKLAELKPQRSPLGWDQITDLSFRTKGWGNKAAAGTVVYIENMYLSGEAIGKGATTPSTDTSGSNTNTSSSTITYDEVEANKSKAFYYNNFDSKDEGIGRNASVQAKSNYIGQDFDSGDNGYVDMTVKAGKEDMYFEAQFESLKANNMIVEIDVSTESSAPSGNLQYKDSTTARNQGALFAIDENGGIYISGDSAKTVVATLKKGKWVKLGFIVDLANQKHTAYVDGKKVGTYTVKKTSNDIKMMRMYVNAGEKNADKSLLVDNFAVYTGTEFRDISKDEIKTTGSSTASGGKISAKAGKDVEMVQPSLADIKGGVALMINKSDAYAKDALTKVDPSNEAVVPVIVNDRTLVPVRFISESFDADVSWDDAARKATVKTQDKTIELTIDSNKMLVNGAEKEIDVPAAIINDRTMLPLRALVESLGKNVLWDTRGLIVITNPDVQLDAEKDVKLSTMLIGLIENGITASNYAAAPKFTQSIIDEACAAPCGAWSGRSGNSNSGEKSANVIYYLTLAARFDPNAAATDGTLCKDAALKQIRFLLEGGHEPFACVGCYWGHAVVASAMLIVKNTPVVYDELTADEKDRMDWLMRALAIAGNWGFNDANNYSTGFDLMGNFGKGWNPNYRNTYLSVVLTSSMYFGAEELDKIYTSFDYDTYVKKYEELGFTNILATWTVAGKDLMENGGECTLLGGIGLSYMEAGQSGGTGKGVKIPFLYNGKGPSETEYLFKNLAEFTYAWEVLSEYGTPGTDDHTHILSGKKSPFEGQMGMMREFAGSDGGSADGKGSNIRSRCTYGYDSYEILVSVYANMKLLGGWDSSTEEMRKIDNRIYVGNEDLLFKMQEGYYGYSSGKGSNEYEYSYLSRGHKFVKDIWKNFHCMQNEEVTVTENPNEVKVEAAPKAEPKDGIKEAPAGAFTAVELSNNSQFASESYYSIGENMTKGSVEFDIVLADGGEAAETFDCVVMLDKKAEKITWSTANMLLQFTSGSIKVRNGSEYKNTGIGFNLNYRYHVKIDFDVPSRKYTTYITPTYPTAGTTYTATDYDFRKGGQEIDFVDSICIVKSTPESNIWVENFKINK